MRPFVCAGGGFLLAVLWFDLMFDVQVARPGAGAASEALASISAYYARVTTAARPMNRLVALIMAGTITAAALEAANGEYEPWVRGLSLALVLAPVLIAALRTVPAAVRLGGRRDPPERQRAIARRILAEHLLCFASIAALIGVQLGAG